MLNNTNTAIVVNERVSFSAYNENIHQCSYCMFNGSNTFYNYRSLVDFKAIHASNFCLPMAQLTLQGFICMQSLMYIV